MMRSYKNFIRDQIILFPFSSFDYLSIPSISMKGKVLSAKCELMSSKNAPLSGCAARREIQIFILHQIVERSKDDSV